MSVATSIARSIEGLDHVVDVAATNAASVDADARFPREAVDALAASGLLGLTIPGSVGGRGGGPAEFLETTRTIASQCASSAMIYLMHVCAAQVTLAGTPSGDSEAIRGLASDERLGTLAFSEREVRGATSGRGQSDRRRQDLGTEVVRHQRRTCEHVCRVDPARRNGRAAGVQSLPGRRRAPPASRPGRRGKAWACVAMRARR